MAPKDNRRFIRLAATVHRRLGTLELSPAIARKLLRDGRELLADLIDDLHDALGDDEEEWGDEESGAWKAIDREANRAEAIEAARALAVRRWRAARHVLAGAFELAEPPVPLEEYMPRLIEPTQRNAS